MRSRTGFVITLGGIPVLWASKLQTEISLSTMAAEYIALSTSLRDLLPMRELIAELASSLGIDRSHLSTVSTVWEDNAGTLILANTPMPRVTPRSKHFAVKYHWFRTQLIPGSIEVRKIDTSLQKADIFTKSLRTSEFVSKRKMIMGW